MSRPEEDGTETPKAAGGVAFLLHELHQPMTALTNYLAAAHMALQQRADHATIATIVEDACAQSLRAGDILRHLRRSLEG